MKRNIIIALSVTLLAMTSCKMDLFPTGSMTPDEMAQDPGGAVYATDGNYSMFKDQVEYVAYANGNSYVRHYFQMAEFPADNCTLSGRTEDPLYEATCYKNDYTKKNVQTLWYMSYKIIYGANAVIEGVQDGASVESDHIKGENYFLRALCHFNLVNLYAKPYCLGRDNMGVILRTSTSITETKRATVGQIYDQIVLDLKDAIRLMDRGSRRGNAGYACKASAQGLLSRVYLYMGMDQECINVVNEMLAGADPASKLEPAATYPQYFANALNSQETLWAIAYTIEDYKSMDMGQGTIGSMFLTDGKGWGEIYCSDPLCNLYERYPSDIRYTAYVLPQYVEGDEPTAYFPITNLNDEDGRSEAIVAATKTADNNYTFTYEGTSYTTTTELVNGEYPQYYITYNGEKTNVRVHQKMQQRNTYPKYFVSKFSYQDGEPMLSSPVMLRWAEVILNRAEAYAKLNQTKNALDDVNVIRRRAGIPDEGMFSETQMHGYTDVLDIVLDERRMELAFEGHRMFDVYRNKRDMDRRFAGVHPWEIVKYTADKIQYPIPYNEITVSGIPQNPQ